MARFRADPEALRAVAAKLEAISADAGCLTTISPTDAGHADMASSLTEISGMVGDAWTRGLDDLDQLATRLRSGAELYEAVDRSISPGEVF
ncbi:hypothetical protein [uncultured Microbacterium sp.]|uniref:hypothetical protein n=1 Tax=uncultured Microbacterium sp. TaxID=191216 RepID=UPI0025E43062|nr:hypothetical protein [uncultured Microbacterium sp.]